MTHLLSAAIVEINTTFDGTESISDDLYQVRSGHVRPDQVNEKRLRSVQILMLTMLSGERKMLKAVSLISHVKMDTCDLATCGTDPTRDLHPQSCGAIEFYGTCVIVMCKSNTNVNVH